MEQGTYSVYIHKNKINNKVYVGITKQNPKERWRNGEGYKQSPRFYNAIKKYNWDNFDHIILYSNLTQEEAMEKEKELIKEYNSNDENYGYNLTSGGEKHYIFTEEVKEKLRQQKIGENNPQYGKPRTDEQKIKQSKIIKELCMQGGNHCKKVKCIETDIIYYSCKEAARNTGAGNIGQATHIADVCNGKRNKCNGYTWKWV